MGRGVDSGTSVGMDLETNVGMDLGMDVGTDLGTDNSHLLQIETGWIKVTIAISMVQFTTIKRIVLDQALLHHHQHHPLWASYLQSVAVSLSDKDLT